MTKPTKQPKPAKRTPEALAVTAEPNEKPEASRARIVTSSVVRGAVTGRKYARPMFGDDVNLSAYVDQLSQRASKVMAGDMSGVEAMLITQANTLDMIFNELACKAAHCEYLNQMEAHLRHALRAQAQCRATLEALAEIKNPRPVAFVKQANIAHGPQQVNNGASPPARTHKENREQSNQLLEVSHGQWLDTGATGTAGRGDQALETVGAVNRADER
ncbi:hypothetical protein [Ralstonia pseudosolanacearum]|uniref:Uncharacterized protein n=1 Tax=Ralstonia nicotianae (strain ATCC BAA-1114 / GMI1000) TaxID=267608 RepID=Q8XWJ9_RALN1|nr:hypothetical protein [Ralstonia pseudosolanacearum]AST27993.1 hypothetical protein CDC45_12600 [Ralstonia pseudosolanacearum]MCQ4681756.1 hypothetical protein [Ralstonia pseudosolanacearum]MDC6285094.1 hypothetical protein [Ralstonia pseudosolanacearum]CAD16182.1 hypothetical protein RSc2475 [Ralstonia pseudosolanacearum GMI1000]